MIPRQALVVALVIIVIAQSGYTAYFGVNVTGTTDAYAIDNSTLKYPEKGEYVAAVVDEMKSREADNKSPWRAEVVRTSTLNDGALNHYRGLSMFNSMTNETTTILFQNLGLSGWQSGNRFVYNEGTPVLHLFMNLKYLISRADTVVNTYDMKEVSSAGTVKLYENTHYLDLGYVVEPTLVKWKVNTKENSYDPVAKQNEFFKLATGINDPVFRKVNIENAVNESGSTKWTFKAPITGPYVLFADIANDKAVISVKNSAGTEFKKYEGRYKNINPVGYFTEGEEITFDVSVANANSNRVFFYAMDTKVFEQGYNMFKRNVMTTTYFEDGGKIEGTIDSDRDGLFYTSIPYEKGWQAYVDGEEVEITPVGDALLAFPITKGEHSIVLKYKPNGFVPGLIISIIALLGFAAYCVLTYILKKKLIPDYAKDPAYQEAAEE